MRILVIGKFYSEGFAAHIASTLAEMGNDVVRFEVGIGDRLGHGRVGATGRTLLSLYRQVRSHSPAYQRRRQAELVRAARGADLVLSTHDYLTFGEVQAVRSAGARVALWIPDAIAAFGRSMFVSAGYDAVFLKDPFVVRALRREPGIPAFYLPECFNPQVHRRVPLDSEARAEYSADIATAGNLYPNRVAVFSQLREFDVAIWGAPPPGWLDVSLIRPMIRARFVAHDEKAKAFLAARIVLNNLHPAEIWGVNCRAFEACGIGAFQMISWRPGLSQLFRDGVEIVAYRDMNDLLEKVRYYLANEAARDRIAAAGHARAHAEHTYRHRLELLLATLAGQAAAFPIPDAPGTA